MAALRSLDGATPPLPRPPGERPPRNLCMEPRFMQEAEWVREQNRLEREQRRQEDDDARHREERDAYYGTGDTERSET